MSPRRRHDFDDGFDEESLFEDEELAFERIRRRDSRQSPRRQRDAGSSRHPDTPSHRRKLASLKAWGSPY